MFRVKGVKRLTDAEIREKNPVALLNELCGPLNYICLSTWGSGTHQLFSMGINIDGVAYNGIASSKKVSPTSLKCLSWYFPAVNLYFHPLATVPFPRFFNLDM